MMTTLEIPSVLSSSQRRCQVLLMLYLPDAAVTAQSIIAANGVDDVLARQDIAETRDEIQRYHRLDIVTHHDGCYRIEGSALNQRLCLLHWLRRALRLCPHFVAQQFTPALKTALKQHGIARPLYDDANLRALINFARASFSASLSPATYSFYSFICNIVLFSIIWAIRRSFHPFSAAGRNREGNTLRRRKLSVTGNGASRRERTVMNSCSWRCCL